MAADLKAIEMPDFLRDVTPLRGDSFQRLLECGLPSTRAEDFRYTNIARVLRDFSPATDIDSAVAVASGISLNTRPVANGPEPNGALPLLNHAFNQSEYVLRVAAGEVVSSAQLNWLAPSHTLSSPRLIIEVGPGGHLTLDENMMAEGSAWMNGVVDIVLHPQAQMIHVRRMAAAGLTTALACVTVGDGARYDLVQMTQAAGMVRHDVSIDLCGPRAQAYLSVAQLSFGRAHHDLTARVRHMAPDTVSVQNIRNVVDDQARAVYQGRVYVDPMAQRTDGRQLAKSLLLSDMAEVDVKPELEIFADDVKCAHGATCGSLDATALFYLMSRGIPEAESWAILIEAFVAEIFAALPESLDRSDFESWVHRGLQEARS